MKSYYKNIFNFFHGINFSGHVINLTFLKTKQTFIMYLYILEMYEKVSVLAFWKKFGSVIILLFSVIIT